MSGLDLIREVRQTHGSRDVPIIVVSSLVDDDITWPVWRAGADAWVTRPFDPDVLTDNITRFIADSAEAG